MADNIEIVGEKIILTGNAQLTSSQNDTIETNEIIIDKNIAEAARKSVKKMTEIGR